MDIGNFPGGVQPDFLVFTPPQMLGKQARGGGVIKSVDDVDLSMRFSHDYRDVERRRK